MNHVIEQLQEDHRQLVHVLYNLEREVKACGGLSSENSSMEAILDILDYIQVYPEIWHHPAEDALYEVLLGKDVGAAALVAHLIEEHGVLELLTENLLEYINQIVVSIDAEAIKMRFIKSTNDYISRQLHHMEQEQLHLFPLIERHLTEGDWLIIKGRLQQQRQSEDGPTLEYYHSFYRKIVNNTPVTV
ncbi:MAG: hemerythrin domain-containing protein [Oceanicoccus sp.]